MIDWYYQGLLFAILLAASWFDIKARIVPNQLILVGLIAGILMNAWVSTPGRFSFGLYGLLIGFGVMVVPYALNWLGAGDVKLFAVVGLFLGSEKIIDAAILTAFCGGLLALYYLIKMKITKAQNLPLMPSSNKPALPYVIAIFGGTLLTLIFSDSLV